MDKHLGKFIIDSKILPVDDCEKISSDVATDRIKNIIFCFSKCEAPISITQIAKFELFPNNNIFIEAALFSPNIYNAYVSNWTVDKMIENGYGFNPIDCEKYGDYKVEYYNYRFKEFSFSRNENIYSFILEPIEED